MAKTTIPIAKPAAKLTTAAKKFEEGRAKEMADFQSKLDKGKTAIKTARNKLK